MNSEMRLLDTNIVSYMFNEHSLAAKYRWHVEGFDWAISFQSLGELEEGADQKRWGTQKRRRMKEFLRRFTVIHSDDLIVNLWARIRAECKNQPIGVADCWIAATALAYQLELVTHNPADFAGITGLTVVSESP